MEWIESPRRSAAPRPCAVGSAGAIRWIRAPPVEPHRRPARLLYPVMDGGLQMNSAPARQAESVPEEQAEPAPKKHKHCPEVAFEVDGGLVWSGSKAEFNGGQFMRLSILGANWLAKSIIRTEKASKPLALHYLDENLQLDCTVGILPATFVLNGRPKPRILESEIACISGFKPIGKSKLIWDLHAQAIAKTAAVSLADLNCAKDTVRIDSVSTASIQRLGLLVMLSGCRTVNNDDILLRPVSGGGLEVVLGDANKAFHEEGRERDPTYPKAWDEENHKFRQGGPLDQMAIVLSGAADSMSLSDRYDHIGWSDDGWKNEDGEDRRALANRWVRWEERPLAESVAQIVQSWTTQNIDTALDAHYSAVREYIAMAKKLDPDNEFSTSDGPDAADENSPKVMQWKVHWKKEMMLLREQVEAGRRPSLLDISLSIGKQRE